MLKTARSYLHSSGQNGIAEFAGLEIDGLELDGLEICVCRSFPVRVWRRDHIKLLVLLRPGSLQTCAQDRPEGRQHKQ